MTSRFREELALRPDGPGPRRRGGPGHGRDRRPGRLLQRADRPARPARPRPVRVHDPALGRDRRGDRRRPRGRLGADPAAGDPGDPRPADRPLRRSGTVARTRRRGRAVGPPRPPGHAPPGRGPRPDARASCSCSGRRSCTSGSTLPTPRSCRPRSRRARRSTASRREFGEGEFAPIVLADPDDRRRDDAGQPRRAVRLLAPARRRPADHAASTASSTSTRA